VYSVQGFEVFQEMNTAPVPSFFQLIASLHMKFCNVEGVGRQQIWKKKLLHYH